MEAILNAPSNSVVILDLLHVPVQQTARLYNELGPAAFTEEELQLLYSLNGGPESFESYSPFLSDMMNSHYVPNMDLLKEKLPDFIMLWLRNGIRHPWIYFMATSSNTYQAWYPGTAVYSAYGYNYFEIGNNDSYYSAPKIKGLYDWIVNMYGNADSCGYDKLIFFRVLGSMGTHFCVMIFSFILAIVKKRRNQVAFIAFIIVMVLGYLFGPLSSIRYYLILFMVSPILCLFDFNVSTSKKLYNTQ